MTETAHDRWLAYWRDKVIHKGWENIGEAMQKIWDCEHTKTVRRSRDMNQGMCKCAQWTYIYDECTDCGTDVTALRKMESDLARLNVPQRMPEGMVGG